MKKILRNQFMIRAALAGFMIFAVASCTEPPTSPADSGSNVVMRTQLDNSTVHSSSAASNLDSLQVISAAYAASNFMLRSDLSDDRSDPNLAEGFIRPPQFLLAFDAGARQYIGENIIYAGTYRRARFDLHPLQGSPDSLAVALGPLYRALFEGSENTAGNTTIVIRGYVWKDGIRMPFTYSSRASGNGSVYFDKPLVVVPATAMEILVRFSSSAAFTDSSGAVMDPRDGKNAAAIETNIKEALKADLNNIGS